MTFEILMTDETLLRKVIFLIKEYRERSSERNQICQSICTVSYEQFRNEACMSLV